MKALVVILAIVLVLIGGSVGVMWFMELGPFATADAADEAVSEATEPSEPPRFVEMRPMVISIFQDDSVAATIQIELTLETIGASNEDTLRQMMPRLSNAFIQDLHGFLPRHLSDGRQLDVNVLKHRLLAIGTKVTGPGVIHEVLIQSIVDIPRE